MNLNSIFLSQEEIAFFFADFKLIKNQQTIIKQVKQLQDELNKLKFFLQAVQKCFYLFYSEDFFGKIYMRKKRYFIGYVFVVKPRFIVTVA